MKKMEYRRLPGGGFSFAGMRYRLWLGGDHLLCVSGPGYTEEYRRFYYRDIQAIITRRTARGEVLSIVFASLAGIVAAVFIPIGMREGEGAFVGGGVLFGLFLLLLVYLDCQYIPHILRRKRAWWAFVRCYGLI